MKVKYKYDIDDVVTTPFGMTGIVSMLGYDDGGPQYYVKTEKVDTWFKEKQLEKNRIGDC